MPARYFAYRRQRAYRLAVGACLLILAAVCGCSMREALRLDPAMRHLDDADQVMQTGGAKKVEQARRLFDEALADSPDDIRVYVRIYQTLSEHKRWEVAVEYLEKARARFAKAPERERAALLTMLGHCYYEQ